MKKYLPIAVQILLACSYTVSMADDDARKLVQLPEMMQQHMMLNMRDHLVAINEILITMAKGDFEDAAEVAEYRLGMSLPVKDAARLCVEFESMPKTNTHTARSTQHAARLISS